MVQPEILDADYSTFCVKACLIDDSHFRTNKARPKVPHKNMGALTGPGPGSLSQKQLDPWSTEGGLKWAGCSASYCNYCHKSHKITCCHLLWKIHHLDKPMLAEVAATVPKSLGALCSVCPVESAHSTDVAIGLNSIVDFNDNIEYEAHANKNILVQDSKEVNIDPSSDPVQQAASDTIEHKSKFDFDAFAATYIQAPSGLTLTSQRALHHH